MDEELAVAAELNARVFEEVLAAYVTHKLEQVVPRGMRSGWFDASGCVWCLFDDACFVRSGDAARTRRDQQGCSFGLQVYWSMEDVVMPRECDERWVAGRIASETCRQLGEQGYRCTQEWRATAEGEHLGVAFRRRHLWER